MSVVLGGTEVAAFMGLPRPDVAAAFKDPSIIFQKSSINHCGFVARFPPPENSGVVALVVKRNGVEFTRIDGIPLGAALIGWETEPPEREPLISIVLSTNNTPPYFLKRCIESVLQQDYGHWQLCVTDDQSSEDAVFATLQEYARQESRLHLERSVEAQGETAACNACLRNAQADFVVVLHDHDELHPFALREVARSIDEFPEARLFYSDEVDIDEAGVPGQTTCKPEFDQDILLAFNYLGNMIALKRSLASELGGWRPAVEGAHDWDLLVRASESLAPAGIKRMAKPLYRKRITGSKPNLTKIWTKVLEDHVERTGKQARVMEGLFPGSMRLHYAAPRAMTVAVVLRPQDGMFQESVVKMNSGRRVVRVYQPPAQEDVFVFIFGALESLNHLFFEELVAQACRQDFAVTGISRNREDVGGMEVVRRVESFPGGFFAVRRERLEEASGLPMLFTPYAVATFSPSGESSAAIEATQEVVEVFEKPGNDLQNQNPLAEENERLTAAINSIERSLSWRVTKPLRAVMRALRGGDSG